MKITKKLLCGMLMSLMPLVAFSSDRASGGDSEYQKFSNRLAGEYSLSGGQDCKLPQEVTVQTLKDSSGKLHPGVAVIEKAQVQYPWWIRFGNADGKWHYRNDDFGTYNGQRADFSAKAKTVRFREASCEGLIFKQCGTPYLDVTLKEISSSQIELVFANEGRFSTCSFSRMTQ